MRTTAGTFSLAELIALPSALPAAASAVATAAVATAAKAALPGGLRL